ncbi:putative S-adenosyl-L-methionine-dependent methyltransferase [Dioscorea sansibarensis]
MYRDWCESFGSYPRCKPFILKAKKCKLLAVIAEVDRELRPEERLTVRDNVETTREVEDMAKSLHWEIRLCTLQLT